MSIHSAADVFAPRLPAQIQKVQIRFSRCADLWSLRGNWLKLLNILVSYTSLDNLEAPLIFNSRNPASLIGVTERTIGRYLDALQENGLIERVKQQRFTDGQWGCTSIRWSSPALEKYFQPVVAKSGYKSPEAGFGIDLGRRTKLSDKSEISKNKVILKKSPGGEAGSAQEKNAGKSPPQSIPGIPAELVESSLKLGLDRKLVVTLMARCKKSGIRLQDVYLFHVPVILEKGLKGKEAFAWLLRAIASGRDFAWAAKTRNAEKAQTAKQPKRERFIAKVAAALAVQKVRLPSGAWLMGDAGGNQAEIREVASGQFVSRYICLNMLATNLLRNSPMWVRSLLKGRIQPEAPPLKSREDNVPLGHREPEMLPADKLHSVEAFRSRLKGFRQSFSHG